MGIINSVKLDRNVWEHWRRNADNNPDLDAVVHWEAGEEPFRWKWEALIDAASFIAQYLKEGGVKKGDVCSIIIRHNRYFYPIYFAISSIGALPAVLAYPNSRLHPEKFRDGLEGISHRSGLDWVLTERDLEEVTKPLLFKRGSTIKGIFFPEDWIQKGHRRHTKPLHSSTRPAEPCLLQHSSGTTGLQKAVMLSNLAVLEHVQRYGQAIQVNKADKIVSWLPLYHDMGLIATFYLPLTLGLPVVLIDPFEWVLAPIILFEAIFSEKGTLAWLPNFAYNLMADRIRDEDMQGIRLDTVRMLINCSEPVRYESHEKFHRRFSPFGLKRNTLAACYAMAETTFAATQTSPGIPAKELPVDRYSITKGIVNESRDLPNSRVCVSSGRPISGCEVRIVDETGKDLPSDRIGEVAIRSVSLFDCYRNNPEKTRDVLNGGWYFSGDYGFVHEGECYIIGRKKDIIIVAGNNIYPEDIEDAVGKIPGVLPGRVVAFGIDDDVFGTEQICVVAETPIDEEFGRKTLGLTVKEVGMGMDVTISRVYFSSPRWLIKSSSGKPSRKDNKIRALEQLRFV